jgi:hypothetical protein
MMLYSGETPLLGSRHNLPVLEKKGGAIMMKSLYAKIIHIILFTT